MNRFKVPHSKNFNNICPPSHTLHLSNIPDGTDEEELKQAFEDEGLTVAG